MQCVEELIEKEIIEIESSQNFIVNQKEQEKTKKLLFTTPILRFWFAFVSPIYKGIKEKDYKEFYELFENRKNEFSHFITEELAIEYITDLYKDDEIKIIGKYWNKDLEIDIIAKTSSNKIIVGNCLKSNKKAKKDSLNNLIKDCEKINLTPDIYVLFSKNGYTNELKTLKSSEIRLFTNKSFKQLLN